MANVVSKAAIFSEPREEIDLREVLSLSEKEVCSIGEENLKLLDSHNLELKKVYQDLCWTIQAIMEYQDLQCLILREYEEFLQQNYCFYEGLNIFRETCLAGINGNLHVSIGGFRTTLELILAHLYWEGKKHEESNFDRFYDWLLTGRNNINFTDLLSNVEKTYNPPTDWELRKRIREIYSKLCSYVHKTLFEESITTIRESNLPDISVNALTYWVSLTYEVARVVLHLLILAYPLSLFPVDIIKKFGFNTPVGAFFNQCNAVPLKKALGNKKWEAYRLHFKTNADVEYRLNWYNSKPDLSISEVKETWSKEDEGPLPKEISSFDDPNIIAIIAEQKAKIRAIQIGLTYWSRLIVKFTKK